MCACVCMMCVCDVYDVCVCVCVYDVCGCGCVGDVRTLILAVGGSPVVKRKGNYNSSRYVRVIISSWSCDIHEPIRLSHVLLQKELDAELKENDMEQERLRGSNIVYGEKVQVCV